MVEFGPEEDRMGGVPAAAGDMDEFRATSPHLSMVQHEGVDAQETDATIIGIAQPGVSEHRSIIFAW
jgi:hypothetical protein